MLTRIFVKSPEFVMSAHQAFEVSLPLLAETTFHGNGTTYSALIGLGAAACLGAAIVGGWPGAGLRQNTPNRPEHPQPRGVAGDTRCRPPLAQMQEEL